MPCWLVGKRDGDYAGIFIRDLARHLANRVKLTTDGRRPYLQAIESTFGADIDYAMLIKFYGYGVNDERHYSPATCIGTEARPITGNPDPEHVSTSIVGLLGDSN